MIAAAIFAHTRLEIIALARVQRDEAGLLRGIFVPLLVVRVVVRIAAAHEIRRLIIRREREVRDIVPRDPESKIPRRRRSDVAANAPAIIVAHIRPGIEQVQRAETGRGRGERHIVETRVAVIDRPHFLDHLAGAGQRRERHSRTRRRAEHIGAVCGKCRAHRLLGRDDRARFYRHDHIRHIAAE